MVFAKALGSVADGAQCARGNIRFAAHPVVNLAGDRIEEEPVHGEIAPASVGLRVTELHLARMASIDVFAVGAKGGYFKLFLRLQHQHHAKTFANPDRPREQCLHLFRPRAGGDVVIRRREPAQFIAHATAHEIRLVPVFVQAADDFGGGFAGGHVKKNVRPWAHCRQGMYPML